MKLKKEELEKMYRSMSNEDLAKKLGISKVTLVELLRKNGIPLKGKGNFHNAPKIEIL